MIKFATSAALVTFAVAFAAAPASAEQHYGPLTQNGQCWHGQGGSQDRSYGYWGPCATPAAQRTAVLHHPLRPRRDPHNDR